MEFLGSSALFCLKNSIHWRGMTHDTNSTNTQAKTQCATSSPGSPFKQVSNKNTGRGEEKSRKLDPNVSFIVFHNYFVLFVSSPHVKQWGSFEGHAYPTVDPQEEKGGCVWWQGPAWGRRQTFKEKKRVGKKQKAQMDVLLKTC